MEEKFIKILNKKDCTGCRACEQICPVKAISMKEDDEGFITPKVDEERCIKCGLCKKTCGQIDRFYNKNNLEERKFLGVRPKEKEIAKNSTSGGIAYLISKMVIEENGIVFGSAYDENLMPYQKYVKDKKELQQLRGSKYVTSDTKKTFSQVKEFLEEGKKILYIGVPCQIGGLKKFLKKDYENLYTIDIICAPLAPNFDFIVKGQEADFQTGLNALAKLTNGKVYVGVRSGSVVSGMKGVEIVEVEGPHPAANVGVQINHIKPVNKGEVVWTVNPADVIVIGRLFNKGVADFSRMVAITGSETTERGYVKTISGCTIKSLVNGKVLGQEHIRIISGNVLTGTKVNMDGYLGAYDNQITVIPEGDETHEFLGFAMPRFNQFSASHSYFSWLGTSKEYVIDARIKGGKRAMIMSNEYDKVFPMDIYPEYLLKAIIAFDIDKMENLGIYEVAPEDFALCEFVDTSKIELQKIVRDGLNLLYKEMN